MIIIQGAALRMRTRRRPTTDDDQRGRPRRTAGASAGASRSAEITPAKHPTSNMKKYVAMGVYRNIY